jgi:hypothetical protein
MALLTRVGDCLEQEIPVAARARLLLHSGPQIDALVLGDRFVDVTYLPQHFV